MGESFVPDLHQVQSSFSRGLLKGRMLTTLVMRRGMDAARKVWTFLVRMTSVQKPAMLMVFPAETPRYKPSREKALATCCRLSYVEGIPSIWTMDSGSSSHKNPNQRGVFDFRPSKDRIIRIARGDGVSVQGVGKAYLIYLRGEGNSRNSG